MQTELDSLVRKLDRKITLDWVEEMRLGKPAYDHLLRCVRDGQLTRNQTANALHALFRLRTHGSEQEVFELFRAHAKHTESRVRSEAIKLLIGMVTIHDLKPPFHPNACIAEIKMALTRELDHDVSILARDFVAKYDVK
jgi:hypothetical protein